MAGCGASSPPVTPTLRAHPCDPAHWSELADSRLRVWPRKSHAPAHVVEVAGAHVEIASVTSSVIVTRWVPYASLSLIAMSPTTVSPKRGADSDPGLRILVGHRLDPPSYGWSPVHDPEGFVPASFAGVMWTEAANEDDDRVLVASTYRSFSWDERRFMRPATGDVRSGDDDAAAIRMTMTSPTVIQIRSGASNGYLAVTVHLPFAELDGFWKPPPAKSRTAEDEAEAELDMGPPPIHSPIARGTCLHAAPMGRVVGIVRDEDAFAIPVPSKTKGWYAATIPTIWGPTTYYIDTPPIPPVVEPAPDTEWRWPSSTTNEW